MRPKDYSLGLMPVSYTHLDVYKRQKYTSNPILGILVGIGMTALIQSSSGVTVITVGMVSAGLLTLRQAIGIVMGANIGTTDVYKRQFHYPGDDEYSYRSLCFD